MADKGLSVVISAQDRATKTLDQVNTKLKAMSAPVERTGKAFTQLAGNSGLTAVARSARDIATFSNQTFVNLSRAVPAAASLAGALSVAGAVGALAELMKTSAAYANQLKQLSIQSGVTASDLQRIGAAAAAAGGDAQGAMQGVGDLAKNIALLMHTGKGDPAFMAGLSLLGVSLKDVNGHARSTGDVLNDILHKLAAIKDPQQRAYEGAMVLGGAYKDFAFELNNGVQGLDAYQAKAKDMIVANDGQVGALATLQESFNALSGDVTGLGRAIAGDLAPATTEMIDHMSKWLEANHKWLEADITGGIKEIVADAKVFGTEVNSVVQYLGGWKAVAEEIVAIKLGAWAVGVLASLSPLTMALAAIAVTIDKINTFSDRSQLKNLPAGSPFWDKVSQEDQSNYVNSPRSQEFLGNSLTPFNVLNPGTWLGRSANMSSKSAGGGTASISMDAAKRALLDTIAGPESGGRYDARNPTSSASGRYQFINSTWGSVAGQLGLTDRSPQSQDAAAWYLASQTYQKRYPGRNLEDDIKAGGHEQQITAALSSQWASMPGGVQSTESQAQFNSALANNLKTDSAPVGTGPTFAEAWAKEHAPVATGAGSAANPANVNLTGGAHLNVTLGGAVPPGTRVSAATDGNTFAGAPNVVMPMPGAGLGP